MTSATEAPEQMSFLHRLEEKYRPSPGAMFLEDAATMVRLALINGVLIVANTVFIATLLLANDEEAVGWTVAGTGVAYLLSVVAFIVTGRASLYIHGVLWPSLVQNIAAHVLLGGFVWSGANLFWGIIVSVVAALLLGRLPGAILGGAYLVAAIVFAFLEPALQARRSQPALAVSVGLAVNVFVLSVLILVPVVMTLMAQISRERARSEGLLMNVLPSAIAQRLKRSPGVIADAYEGLYGDVRRYRRLHRPHHQSLTRAADRRAQPRLLPLRLLGRRPGGGEDQNHGRRLPRRRRSPQPSSRSCRGHVRARPANAGGHARDQP